MMEQGVGVGDGLINDIIDESSFLKTYYMLKATIDDTTTTPPVVVAVAVALCCLCLCCY